MSEPDMRLPEGKTCADCTHWGRCRWLIEDRQPEETECDWSPSRFRPKPQPKPQPRDGGR